MTAPSLATELAHMQAVFQLRTIATVMGADPELVDAKNLRLSIDLNAESAANAPFSSTPLPPARPLPTPVPGDAEAARDHRGVASAEGAGA